jgi:glycosyltransferase involved in cell wall biosynthesis
MTSVVIAAHNEAAVIGATLRALRSGAAPDGLDITVVANGCTDGTAAVAGAVSGVRVVELESPGKPAALNAGDEVAVGFPRVYLDADIQIPATALATVTRALDTHLAAVPGRALDLAGRPLLVRAYYAIHSRLPVFADGLFGRGVIALSAGGRARFDRFPEIMADDLFLDAQFTVDEKCVVEEVTSRVATPLRTADLVRRLVRVRAGNAALRAGSAGSAVRSAARLSWLRDVVLPRPWLAPAAVCYVGITLTAALLARRARAATTWGRDESSRAGAR